ncbi:hypothetical protein N7510_000809 [Penicillium lagena]|uniref:uncharacterized protein n=1 Tax=Penicillium lagena TaxID=94218 RepID=UPI0025423D12|nr:uncharacterized protein N7510_000809 [Penicillium lagena]KAJ5624500.1 hypothetical protein N7510_000809 [Penicillium lagena]
MVRPRSKRPRTSDARTSVSEEEESSPISCESCRQKKCKCDRKLGLPLGYLNQLEQRLAETEQALYGALVTLRSMQPVTMIRACPKPETAPKQKAARVEEWTRLPLREWPDLERWSTVMSEQFSIELPAREVLYPAASGGDVYSGPITPGHLGGTRNWSRLGGPRLHSASYLSTERALAEGGHEERRQPAPMLETCPSSSAIHGTVAGSASIARSPSEMGECARSLPAARDGDPTTTETGPARQLTQRNPNIYF